MVPRHAAYDAVMADGIAVITGAARATASGDFRFVAKLPIRLPSRSG